MAAAIQKLGLSSTLTWPGGQLTPPLNLVIGQSPPHTKGPGNDRVLAAYEAGGFILFPKPDLPIATADWKFLDSLPVPRFSRNEADNPFKKTKLPALMTPWKPGHVLEKLGFNETQIKRLQGIIPVVNARFRAIIPALFPGYEVVRENISWRLTETGPEDPHYDAYGYEEDELHTVRIFVNLDNQPRKWSIGPPINETLRKYPDAWAPFKDRHPNIINDKINTTLPWAEIPMGEIEFAPGALWMVNSQIVSHAILWGRRMAAASFKIDHNTMGDPTKNFTAVARRAMAS